jgi:NADH dehydrogenase FAD-containing subunit
VVVVGGGFGGLQAVRLLRNAEVEVTLVDRRNYHLFQPLLYQVATGALSPEEIAQPLRGILARQRNARVVLAEVTDIHLQRQAWLTFAVIGAGPTGLELAGQIAEIARDTLRREFRTIGPSDAVILLVEATGRAPPRCRKAATRRWPSGCAWPGSPSLASPTATRDPWPPLAGRRQSRRYAGPGLAGSSRGWRGC